MAKNSKKERRRAEIRVGVIFIDLLCRKLMTRETINDTDRRMIQTYMRFRWTMDKDDSELDEIQLVGKKGVLDMARRLGKGMERDFDLPTDPEQAREELERRWDDRDRAGDIAKIFRALEGGPGSSSLDSEPSMAASILGSIGVVGMPPSSSSLCSEAEPETDTARRLRES